MLNHTFLGLIIILAAEPSMLDPFPPDVAERSGASAASGRTPNSHSVAGVQVLCQQAEPVGLNGYYIMVINSINGY